jgi:hypothetical protein
MDSWLIKHLQDIGAWNSDGVSRRLRPSKCQSCHAGVLTALDDDVCGLVRRFDPRALTAMGEAAYLLVDQPTYQVTIDGRPNQRGAIAIKRGDNAPVIAEHLCGMLGRKDWFAPAPRRIEESDECPF